MVAESPVSSHPSDIAASMLARVDEFEKFIVSLPPTELPVTHRFLRIYARTIFMPRGSILTSRIHKTRHPFEITKGQVAVWTSEDGWQRYRAPYSGITEPGTKRILVVEEDCVWTTFHETDLTDVAEIERAIIEPHDNPLLTAGEKLRIVDVTK